MSPALRDTRLSQPIEIGGIKSAQRIFMSSLTGYRNDDNSTPTALMKEYYIQRATTPGTLIFSEATSPSPGTAGLHANQPGIWSEAQIAAWREITDAVHAKSCFIFCQLFAAGRAAMPELLSKHGLVVKGPSAIGVDDEAHVVPTEMTEEDIAGVIEDLAQGARVAVERAGFDGVEIHNAYGTLTDQFCHESANQRTDSWGGSIERRSKFTLEVAKAVIAAVGKDKVGIRFSPYSTYLGMEIRDPLPHFVYLVSELRQLGLAWLHLVEPRMHGIFEVVRAGTIRPLIEAWGHQTPVNVNGGFTPDNVREAIEHDYKDFNVAVSFGRWFIANPDLIERLRNGVQLNAYDWGTFYKAKAAEGYVDYPFSGATGIGAATVNILADAGANVVISDVNEAAAQQLCEEQPTVSFVKCDVTSYDDIYNLFKEALDKYGRVDHAVSCAGIFESGNWFDPNLTVDSVKKDSGNLKTLDVNVIGTLQFSRIAAVFLREGGKENQDKSLTILSSVNAFRESPSLYIYQTGKHAVHGLLRSSRKILWERDHIRVNAICPGVRESEMTKGIIGAFKEHNLYWQPAEAVGKVIVGIEADPSIVGKAYYIEGGDAWEFEDSVYEYQQQWLGEEGTRRMRVNLEAVKKGALTKN